MERAESGDGSNRTSSLGVPFLLKHFAANKRAADWKLFCRVPQSEGKISVIIKGRRSTHTYDKTFYYARQKKKRKKWKSRRI